MLRVCTATVYDLIEREELEHVRVSNAIRVIVRGSSVPDGTTLAMGQRSHKIA